MDIVEPICHYTAAVPVLPNFGPRKQLGLRLSLWADLPAFMNQMPRSAISDMYDLSLAPFLRLPVNCREHELASELIWSLGNAGQAKIETVLANWTLRRTN